MFYSLDARGWVRVGNSGSGGAGNFSLPVYRSAYRNGRSSGNFERLGGLDLNAALRLLRPKIGRMRLHSGAPVDRFWILRWSWMRGDRLELLDDDAAVKSHDLGLLMEPIERGFLGVAFVAFESKVVRGFERGRIFRPFAANPDWIERDFSSSVFLESFEIRKQGTASVDAELTFASA